MYTIAYYNNAYCDNNNKKDDYSRGAFCDDVQGGSRTRGRLVPKTGNGGGEDSWATMVEDTGVDPNGNATKHDGREHQKVQYLKVVLSLRAEFVSLAVTKIVIRAKHAEEVTHKYEP